MKIFSPSPGLQRSFKRQQAKSVVDLGTLGVPARSAMTHCSAAGHAEGVVDAQHCIMLGPIENSSVLQCLMSRKLP